MTRFTVEIDEIRSLEEALHRPEVRRSRQAVQELLAEGFVEFGSSGAVYERDEVIDLLAQEQDSNDDSELNAFDYSLTFISDGAVLLTYRTRRTERQGREWHALRSSIWKHTGARWQMVFHQGTITKPPV
ncbi:DUF4440 domain-containing protein [Mesorhizobium sp. KR2-14]|uniref:nuclear transport factor 2 family protein n=1 Tax=Mesorhizobium sp. KR2-14 TaxID=3156610 RepID=UPI0032B5D073